jgi:hypothetical protein
MRRSHLVCAGALLLAAVAAPLPAQQGGGHLKVNVNPGRAGVFVDGKYLGPAGNFRIGRKYALPAGEHEVRLTEPRYKEVVTKVTIQPGKTTVLEQNMEWGPGYRLPENAVWEPLPPANPPFGRLRAICEDKFAAVYLNGAFMGHAGEFNNWLQGVLINPGSYMVRIVPLSGKGGLEQQVKIEAGKTVVVRTQN